MGVVKTTTIAPFGGPVDACTHKGRIVVAWQSGKDTNVRLVYAEIDPVSHAILLSMSWPLGDDVGAFPRLLSAHDSVWLFYREGASLGGRAVLRRDGTEVWRSPVECGGNDPVCLGLANGEGIAAWQRSGDNRADVFCIPTMLGDGPWAGRPTGLSHFTATGDLVLVDDARGAVSGMTRPSWAGALVAGEHPDSGALVLAADGRQLRAFSGQESVTPRLAHDPQTGTYAVVTSGVRAGVDYGVRLATFTEADLAQPVEPDAPFPPGKGWTRLDVDRVLVAPFLLGTGAYARKGTTFPLHYPETYTHLYQSRRTPWGCQVVKALGAQGEIIRSTTITVNDRGEIGFAYDDTNELDAGYRVVNPGTDDTAIAYLPVMQVGVRLETPVEILPLAGTRRPVVLWTEIDAVYRHDVTGRRAAVIGWTFDIIGDGVPGDPIGMEEWSLCLEGDEAFPGGLIAWRERKRATGVVRTMYADIDVPRIPDPTPRFADALPKAPTPETPDMPLKPRDQFFAEFTQINDFYAAENGLQRPGGMVIDGGCDVVAMRQWGYDLMTGQSVEQVKAQIRQSDEWKAKHPDDVEPPPPSTSDRLGPLTVSWRVYRDANGNRLPLYIHAGDLISRFSRDESGARRMLDEIVTLRADGGRFWSWLIGDPYWTGRFFRGDWSVLQRFVAECKARNLRLVLSQGDLWQAGEATARRWFTDLAGFIRAEGPEWFDFVDGGNEVWHNPYGTEPETIASAMRPLAGIGPILSLSDFLADQEWPGNTADERKAAMLREAARWKQTPAMVQDGHPAYSDGDGCVRRTWNFAYELETDAWMNSEPRGFGRNVTVYNRVDRSVQLTTATATWMTGGAYVAMSSPGVISDGMKNGHFDAGESFLEMPGFNDLDALRRWLPQNVGGWRRVHGGYRTGSGRVFAVDNDDTRCDHAINDATGEYVAILYAGPYHQERPASVEDFDPQLGGGRRIVKGRIR